jgi:hypothetical protein
MTLDQKDQVVLDALKQAKYGEGETALMMSVWDGGFEIGESAIRAALKRLMTAGKVVRVWGPIQRIKARPLYRFTYHLAQAAGATA